MPENTNQLTGRDLDAAVAEMMGCRFWLEQRGKYRLAVMRFQGDREPWMDHKAWDKERQRYEECDAATAVEAGFFGTGLLRYSDDIAAAWQVVEWMRAKLWSVEVHVFPDLAPLCRVHCHGCGIDMIEAEGETAEEAICRAALMAVHKLHARR